MTESVSENPEKTTEEIVEPAKVVETPPSDVVNSAAHKRPTARAWLIAAISGSVALVGIAGFILGGIATAFHSRDRDLAATERVMSANAEGNMQRAMDFRRPAMSAIAGSITAVSDTGLTVKYDNGTSVSYTVDGNTQIVDANGTAIKISDLKTGKSVSIHARGTASTQNAMLIELTN